MRIGDIRVHLKGNQTDQYLPYQTHMYRQQCSFFSKTLISFRHKTDGRTDFSVFFLFSCVAVLSTITVSHKYLFHSHMCSGVFPLSSFLVFFFLLKISFLLFFSSSARLFFRSSFSLFFRSCAPFCSTKYLFHTHVFLFSPPIFYSCFHFLVLDIVSVLFFIFCSFVFLFQFSLFFRSCAPCCSTPFSSPTCEGRTVICGCE